MIELTTSRRKPWYHVGRRTGLGSVFAGQKERWCRTCGQEMDYRIEHRYEGEVYASKEWCARCGRIINWGVFGGDETQEAVRQRARQWATSLERDRR